MKNYTVGQTFALDGKTYKVLYPANLNAQCEGCCFKNKFCEAPSDLVCYKPSRIFKQITVKNKPKKNTFWRKLKATLIWHDRFMSNPENRQLLEMNRILNNQIF